MRKTDIFEKHLRENRAVKISCDLYNFSKNKVKDTALAAKAGLASAISVAATKENIKIVKENVGIPLFAVSVHPFKLLEAVKLGADAIEIGHYRDLCMAGVFLSATDIYEIVLESMNLTQKYNPYVCVGIPSYLSETEQIRLAQGLEILGVDLIQIETVSKVNTLQNKENTDLKNTKILTDNIGIPVITSATDIDSAYHAFKSGAIGVNLGHCITDEETKVGMMIKIREIIGSLSYNRNASRDLKNEATKINY